MPWKSDTTKHGMLDAIFNNTAFSGITTLYGSLHDGHPGNTGANEITGGPGPYAREDISAAFAAAASGGVVSNAAIEWTGLPAVGPAPAGIFYVGFWDISSGGTAANYYGYAPIDGVYGYGVGANTGDVITSYAHGLVNDDRVVINASIGQGLPAGPSEDTLYHVVGATTDTFQISATQGGAAVAFTSDGEMVWHKLVGKVTNSGDTLQVASGQLSVNEET